MTEYFIALLVFFAIMFFGLIMLHWTAEKHWENRRKGDKANPVSHEEGNIFQIFFLFSFLSMVILTILCFRVVWELALFPGAAALFLIIPVRIAFKRGFVW